MMLKRLAVLLLAFAAMAVPAYAGSSTKYYVAWRNDHAKFAWHYGKLYAQWECTLGGTVLAAGATFVGATAPWTIFGILAGGSFTSGCELGAPWNPGRMSGVPFASYCWKVYPRGAWKSRFEECIA